MTTEQIDREIIAAVRDGEDDAAFVDRLAPCEARDFALGRDGFGAVSADYIPARDSVVSGKGRTRPAHFYSLAAG